MEIPIQNTVYTWANYSVSNCINFIPKFWNVLILLKFYFIPSFLVLWTYNLWDHCAETGSRIRGANTNIWEPIRIFEGKYGYFLRIVLRANNQLWLLAVIGHAKTNILQQICNNYYYYSYWISCHVVSLVKRTIQLCFCSVWWGDECYSKNVPGIPYLDIKLFIEHAYLQVL